MLRFMFNINQPSLPTPFYSVLVSISVFMALSTVFHSINSPDNPLPSHSVFLVLFLPYWSFWTIYLFMKVSFSPDIIASGWLGSMHQLINKLTAPGRWAFSYRKAVFGPLTCAIILVRAVHTKARNHWRVSTVDSKELTAFLYSVAVELWLGYRVQRASKPVKNSCRGWCLVS